MSERTKPLDKPRARWFEQATDEWARLRSASRAQWSKKKRKSKPPPPSPAPRLSDAARELAKQLQKFFDDVDNRPEDFQMKIERSSTVRFLKQADVRRGPTYTIKNVTLETMPKGGEQRRVMHFEERPEVLRLNATMQDALIDGFGSDESDDWKGEKVTLYWDPDIMFGDRVTGGIRLKVVARSSTAAPTAKKSPLVEPAAPKQEEEPELSDEIPFALLLPFAASALVAAAHFLPRLVV